MEDKIKVLFYGDAPCVHTGFGQVARNILLRLNETGKYQFICLGINHYGDPHDLEGILKIFPVSMHDMQGRERLLPLLQGFKPDVFFTINDYDALSWVPQVLQHANDEQSREIQWAWYFPIDGEPFAKRHLNMIKRFVKFPVTYTKWATEVIKKTDPDFDVPYVYHGVDKTRFKPLSKERKREIKEQLGIDPDAFVVLGLGVNQLRKQYNMLIEAFKYFRQGKEGKVQLYLHTQQNTRYGWDIPNMVINDGLEKEVSFTNGIQGPLGIHPSQMNYIYNLADVAVYPHVGEGFGFGQIEAMAAGTPVITHGVTSSPEVVRDAAIQVPTEKIQDPLKPKKKIDLKIRFPFGDRCLYRPIISLSKLVEAMNVVYENEDKREEMSRRGLEIVRNSPEFDWDNIAQYFDDLLTKASKSSNTIDLDLDEIL